MLPAGNGLDGPKRRSGPKSKTSCYLGVTQYKRTGRWEAHIWDSSDPEYKKGRQLHLGSFPAAVPAAIAYDRAAYIIRPRNSSRNFPMTDYAKDDFIVRHAHLTKAEFVTQLRNWAQDPHLAVEYSATIHRTDCQPRPPVLTPPLEPPLRQVQQPFASPARQHSPPQLFLSKRAHPTGLPRAAAPLAAPRAAVLPAPPASPLPRPALKRPRSQLKTRPRSNIQPVAAPVAQRFATFDDDSDFEEGCQNRPAPSMVMLLMAMKASEAEAQARPGRINISASAR